MRMSTNPRKVISILAIVATTLGLLPSSAYAAPAIDHDPVQCIVAGSFPEFRANFSPGAEVANARLYFKASDTPDWYWVPFSSEATGDWKAVLPKPAPSLRQIDYYLSVFDPQGRPTNGEQYHPVVSTRTYCENQALTIAQPLDLERVELVVGLVRMAQQAIPSGFFSEGIATTVLADGTSVATANAAQAGTSTTTTTGASSGTAAGGAGTAAASSGISTTAWVVGGVAIAAGAVAAASGGGDDGGGGSSSGGGSSPTPIASGICYLDTSCSSGNQRRVRDSGNGQCVSDSSCSVLWECSQGPTSGSCNGGSQECVFSPGCASDAQRCSNGLCENLGVCYDRIRFTNSPCPSSSPQPSTGDVAFRLTWSGRADLDLYVKEPNGTLVYFGNRSSSTGGRLDVDSNANCGSVATAPTENIYWPTGRAPRGRYEVWVRSFNSSSCPDSTTSFTLRILRGSSTAQTYSGSLRKGQESTHYFYTY